MPLRLVSNEEWEQVQDNLQTSNLRPVTDEEFEIKFPKFPDPSSTKPLFTKEEESKIQSFVDAKIPSRKSFKSLGDEQAPSLNERKRLQEELKPFFLRNLTPQQKQAIQAGESLTPFEKDQLIAFRREQVRRLETPSEFRPTKLKLMEKIKIFLGLPPTGGFSPEEAWLQLTAIENNMTPAQVITEAGGSVPELEVRRFAGKFLRGATFGLTALTPGGEIPPPLTLTGGIVGEIGEMVGLVMPANLIGKALLKTPFMAKAAKAYRGTPFQKYFLNLPETTARIFPYVLYHNGVQAANEDDAVKAFTDVVKSPLEAIVWATAFEGIKLAARPIFKGDEVKVMEFNKQLMTKFWRGKVGDMTAQETRTIAGAMSQNPGLEQKLIDVVKGKIPAQEMTVFTGKMIDRAWFKNLKKILRLKPTEEFISKASKLKTAPSGLLDVPKGFDTIRTPSTALLGQSFRQLPVPPGPFFRIPSNLEELSSVVKKVTPLESLIVQPEIIQQGVLKPDIIGGRPALKGMPIELKGMGQAPEALQPTTLQPEVPTPIAEANPDVVTETLPEPQPVSIAGETPPAAEVPEVTPPLESQLPDKPLIAGRTWEQIQAMQQKKPVFGLGRKKPPPLTPQPVASQEPTIGDGLKVMGVDSILADTITFGGVRYELYNDARLKNKGGAVRVKDIDSGEVVTVQRYPSFDQAEKVFKDAEKSAAKAEAPIPLTEATPQVAGKEPWQMTREEYTGKKPSEFTEEMNHYQTRFQQHGWDVEQALAEGKPVPPEVLADYPDLKPKPQKGIAKGEKGFIRLPEQKPKLSDTLRPDATPEGKVALKKHKAQEKAFDDIRKPTIQKFLKGVQKHVFDVTGNVENALWKSGDLGKKVVMKKELGRGGTAAGNEKIDNMAREVTGGLSKEEVKILNRIAIGRRTQAIESYKPDHKSPISGANEQKYMDSLPEGLLEKLNPRVDIFFQRTKEHTIDLMLSEGIISEAEHAALDSKGDYLKREYVDRFDPERVHQVGTKKITVRDSGIKSLKEGSEQALQHDIFQLAANSISATYGRVFNNRANKLLHQLAVEQPENGIVSIAQEGAKLPPLHSKISVMVDNNPVEMVMPDEFAEEWVNYNPAIKGNVANFFRTISGTKLLKAMATGYNPGFAVRNMPRDATLVFFSTNEYSPNVPVFMKQLAEDLRETRSDAWNKTGLYVDVANEGMLMDFLTLQGQAKHPAGSKMARTAEIMGRLGNFSEIWTRLALTTRALKNGKSLTEATWIARTYLDFSQGGDYIKAADTISPYLNPKIQALRSMGRGFKENPAKFSWKMLQYMGIKYSLALLGSIYAADTWKNIDEYYKDNFLVIPTPFYKKDSKGRKRYYFVTIPTDQTLSSFGTIANMMADATLGKEVDPWRGVQAAGRLLTQLGPDLNSVPPALKAPMQYAANYDFWRNKDIWGGQEFTDPSKEFYESTHPFFKKVGAATGLSPIRMENAVNQFFPESNSFIRVIKSGSDWLMDGLNEKERDEFMDDITSKIPITRSFFRTTNPYVRSKELRRRYYDALKKGKPTKPITEWAKQKGAPLKQRQAAKRQARAELKEDRKLRRQK